ncbi:polyprenyl synthetase family protein [Nocardioides sp. 503]|uniref:polyprenyl synthetase family protein n=1 Tax=Nocardioides sp. 503 TaxID=2508326 RepID=UPI00106F4416|nr:polyprenyl synthetase family protein [Nocardioides sp. 503]
MTSGSTDDALHRLLTDGRARAAQVDPAHARLWECVVEATQGGKRFRPALVGAAHEALGGTCGAAAAQVGAAVELLHTAFVIHDDVIDGDQVRRGRLNVSGTFSAQAREAGASPEGADELGLAAGILAGDLALAAAIRAVATCGAATEVVGRLLDLFDAALHTTAAGELADVTLALHPGSASLRDSLAMEEQKTSAYSFALPLQAGAVLAGADEHTVDRLGRAGRMLGVAFQLVDDLIGVFGDPAQTGKSATGDLRTSKQTPLLIHATTAPEWPEIRSYVGRDLTDEEFLEAKRLLTSCGSRGFVEALVDTYLAEARKVVEDLGIPSAIVPALSACLPGLARRKEVAA